MRIVTHYYLLKIVHEIFSKWKNQVSGSQCYIYKLVGYGGMVVGTVIRRPWKNFLTQHKDWVAIPQKTSTILHFSTMPSSACPKHLYFGANTFQRMCTHILPLLVMSGGNVMFRLKSFEKNTHFPSVLGKA